MRAMMVAIACALSSSCSVLAAQGAANAALNDRIAALNAVLLFRGDLRGDSILIARCRLPGAEGTTGPVSGLASQFQHLLVLPDSALARDEKSCAVFGFADPKVRVLWLDEILEVRKSAAGGVLPPFRTKQIEMTFQLLQGPTYREFHRYVVEPGGVSGVRPGSTSDDFQYVRWRVVEYKLAGWDFHWADDAGHGSGVRRP